MPPPSYQPPLSRWERSWRLALAAGVGALVWGGAFADHQWDQQRWLFWTDPALGLLSLGLVQLRRRHPVQVTALLNALVVVSASSSGAVMLATVSLATRRRWREIVPIGLLGLGLAQVQPLVNPGNERVGPWWLALTTNLGFIIAVLAVGLYVGSRRELVWTLRDRADRAEREQSLRVSQARTNERSRIAREMHDVLAHRISLVAMHAGALAYRTDLGPEVVRESATVIEDAAHQALVELRDVLGVLREETPTVMADPPQPTLADVGPLVAEARANGAHVTLRCHVDGPGVLPTTTGRTVYRIVQEGLTNARKHAPATHVEVAISGRPGAGIDVRVGNPLRVGSRPSPSSGYGLVGLRERAQLQGGRLTSSADGEQFVLDAWLPWPT